MSYSFHLADDVNRPTITLQLSPYIQGSPTFAWDETGPIEATLEVNLPDQRAVAVYERMSLPHLIITEFGRVIWAGPVIRAKKALRRLSIVATGSLWFWRNFDTNKIYSTTAYSEWRKTSSNWPTTAFSGARLEEMWVADNNNRIFSGLKNGQSYNNAADYGMWVLHTPVGGAQAFTGWQFDVEIMLPANWRVQFLTYTDWGSGSPAVQNTIDSAGVLIQRAFHYSGLSGHSLGIQCFNNTGGVYNYVGDDGAMYYKVTRHRAVGSVADRINTTLTVARTNGAGVTLTVGSTAGMYVGMELVINSGGVNSEVVTVTSIPTGTTFVATVARAPVAPGYPIGTTVQGHRVLLSTIAKTALSEMAAGFTVGGLSTSEGKIQSTTLDITEALIDNENRADWIIRQAAKEDYRFGVNKDKIAFLESRVTPPNQLKYTVLAADLEIERDLSEVWTDIQPLYTSTAGEPTLGTVVTDTPASLKYGGLRRRRVVSIPTSNANVAAFFGDVALADSSDPDPTVGLTVRRIFQYIAGRIPAASQVQPMDIVGIRNITTVGGPAFDTAREYTVARSTISVTRGQGVATTLEPLVPAPRLDILLSQR